MTPLLFASVIGAALVSGIFYAFSTFVMRALARLAPSDGIAAMQSINIVVINPVFFLAFFGTGVLCVAATVAALLSETEMSPALVIAGAALYLFGCIGVTMARNVPLNNRLAQADPADAEALWNLYLTLWTRWNHLRTVASVAAAVAFALALGMA